MTQTCQDGRAGGTPPGTYSPPWALPCPASRWTTSARQGDRRQRGVDRGLHRHQDPVLRPGPGTGTVRWTLEDLCADAAGRALADRKPTRGRRLRRAGDGHARRADAGDRHPVADQLGLDDVPMFQLQSGCSGAVQALSVARSMITGGVPHRPGHRRRRLQQAPRPPTGLERCRTRRPRQLCALRRRRGSRRAHRRAPRAASNWPGPQLVQRSRTRTRTGDRWFGLADRHEDRPA